MSLATLRAQRLLCSLLLLRTTAMEALQNTTWYLCVREYHGWLYYMLTRSKSWNPLLSILHWSNDGAVDGITRSSLWVIRSSALTPADKLSKHRMSHQRWYELKEIESKHFLFQCVFLCVHKMVRSYVPLRGKVSRTICARVCRPPP